MTARERVDRLYQELLTDSVPDAVTRLTAALADAERSGMLKVMDEGSLWSFMRSVLSQGGAIQQDYQSGKYNDYEGYSARLDCAARERADQWIAQAIRAQADQEEG